jgi:hypothetical protein
VLTELQPDLRELLDLVRAAPLLGAQCKCCERKRLRDMWRASAAQPYTISTQ